MLTFPFKRPPVLRLHAEDLIVDSFSGCGGASLGIEWATGRSPDIAVNHDPEAIAMHMANHPKTRHFCESVYDVDPVDVCGGRRVGLAWFSPDCFPAGTMVLTRHGYRTIEEIEVGDEVLTHMQRWRKVTQTYHSVRPLIRIRGMGHPGLLVSPEHPFYARRRERTYPRRKLSATSEWVQAADLERGWYWAAPTKFPDADVPEIVSYRGRTMSITSSLMWLAGLYVADGWTRLTDTRADLVITCGRHEIEELRRKLHMWPRAGARSGSDELAWHERETGTAYQFTASHKGLVEWLRLHFGHGAAEKLIPGWALGMNRPFREAFLTGYLTGDGCVNKSAGTAVTIATTVSKALAFGIKALAQSLGHAPRVSLRTDQPDVIEGRKVNVRPAWAVLWRADIDPSHAQSVRADDLEWSPIRERTDDVRDAADVFNIAVEEDESYVVDGIIVHNCTSHSRAKGGKPVSNKSRGLAWIVTKWARAVKPRVVILENVAEFEKWGPLDENDRPDPLREGITFRRWLTQLKNCGYVVEMRELSGMDYGAPTSRKRLFIIARSDGLPIVWPEPTHGPGREFPYRTAADCLDWSIPCPSIFMGAKEARALRIRRPLRPKTLRRIGRGVWRYVLNAADPFIVPVTHGGDDRVHSIREPFRTITGAHRGEFALACPTLIQQSWGERPGQAPRILDLQKPLGTIVAGGIKHAVATAFLQKYKDLFSSAAAGSGLDITSDHAFASQIVKLHGTCRDGQPVSIPLPTIRAKGTHLAEVRTFLAKYHGDEGPRTDMPFVLINGEPYIIVDIGLRMLIARELFRGQGFPDTFFITPQYDDEVLTKEAQVRMVGNSVCPPLAAALVAANFAIEQQRLAVA